MGTIVPDNVLIFIWVDITLLFMWERLFLTFSFGVGVGERGREVWGFLYRVCVRVCFLSVHGCGKRKRGREGEADSGIVS